MKSILEDVGDLQDEKQYETEYNLHSFMGSLKQQMMEITDDGDVTATGYNPSLNLTSI